MGLHVTHNSWQIDTDLPLELIFLGHLAQHFGFRVPESALPASPVEAAWQQQWLEMPLHTYSMIKASVRAALPTADLSAIYQAAHSAYARWFDPPHFTVLAQSAELQQAGQMLWPEFFRSWQTEGGEGLQRLFQIHDTLVKSRWGERLAHQWRQLYPRQPPLRLQIMEVLWPAQYERWLAPTHLLCSVAAFNTPTSEAELFQHIIGHLARASHLISA